MSAAAGIFAATDSTGAPRGHFVPHGATEKDAQCQAALKAHKKDSRPRHIFSDIMDRMHAADYEQVCAIEGQWFGKFNVLKQQFKDGMDKAAFLEKRADMEHRFLEQLHEELSQMEFQLRCFCNVHEQQCPITPRLEQEYSGEYWCEVAGSPCQSYSRMNKSLDGKWLVPQTKVLLCWAYSTRFYEPDSIFHECVTGLGTELLDRVFGAADSAQAIKAPFTREPGSSASYYIRETCNFSPEDIGLPTARRRQYSCMHLSPFVQRIQHFDFETLCFKRRMLDLSCYLVDGQDGSSFSSFSRSLTAANYARFEGYWLERARLCREGLLSETNHCIASLRQEATFCKMQYAVMPTMVRFAMLCDVSIPRCLTACELFLIQGFPDCRAVGKGITEELATSDFPFELGFVSNLRETHLTSLLGNSMHRCQIALWLYFHLATTSKRGIAASPVAGDTIIGRHRPA